MNAMMDDFDRLKQKQDADHEKYLDKVYEEATANYKACAPYKQWMKDNELNWFDDHQDDLELIRDCWAAYLIELKKRKRDAIVKRNKARD